MPEAAIQVLTNLGLPGVVILAMGWWVYRLDSRITVLHKRIEDLQELRVQDAQRIAAEVANLSEALDRQSMKLEAVLLERRQR
jgi:hypothetical protein